MGAFASIDEHPVLRPSQDAKMVIYTIHAQDMFSQKDALHMRIRDEGPKLLLATCDQQRSHVISKFVQGRGQSTFPPG